MARRIVNAYNMGDLEAIENIIREAIVENCEICVFPFRWATTTDAITVLLLLMLLLMMMMRWSSSHAINVCYHHYHYHPPTFISCPLVLHATYPSLTSIPHYLPIHVWHQSTFARTDSADEYVVDVGGGFSQRHLSTV